MSITFDWHGKPISMGRLLVLTDTRTGEQLTLHEGEVAKFRVRDDGSFAFRRRFNGVRSVQKVWTRWQWKRGGSK